MAPVGTCVGDWRFRSRGVLRKLGCARRGRRFFVSYYYGDADLNLVAASAGPRGLLAKSSISIIEAIDIAD